MLEFAERWGPLLLLALLLPIVVPQEGARAFGREATDAQILAIAEAALGSLRSSCRQSRERRCPVQLLESTEAFCTDGHQPPGLRSPTCAASFDREPGPQSLRLGNPTSVLSAAQKRSLWRANRKARVFRCHDGVHYRCAGPLNWRDHVMDWDGFDATFPDSAGIAGISVPALSLSGRRAVVFMGLLCGGGCGQGRFMELEWSASGWHVIRTELHWAS